MDVGTLSTIYRKLYAGQKFYVDLCLPQDNIHLAGLLSEQVRQWVTCAIVHTLRSEWH